VTERFDMDGENPEPPEPADESYADVPDDRVDPHWRPASGARMTDGEWRDMLTWNRQEAGSASLTLADPWWRDRRG
jgi:hypothetical protein